MTIIEKKFRIGELMEYTGFSRQTLDYYTKIGIIRSIGRTDSNYRLYSEDAVQRLIKVKELKERNISLECICKILDERMGDV